MAQKKSAAKREAILEAAFAEFEAHGVADTRMDEIARRAGVAKGTLYVYFENKDAMLQAIGEAMAESLVARLTAYGADDTLSVRGKIEKIFEPLTEENGRSRTARTIRLMWSEGLRNPEAVRLLFERFVQPMIFNGELLARLKADSSVPEAVRNYPMLLMAPFIQGLLLQGIVGTHYQVDMRGLVSGYFDMIFPTGEEGEMNGLTAPENEAARLPNENRAESESSKKTS